MQCRLLAPVAAVVALGLAVSAACSIGRRDGTPVPAVAAPESAPLLPRLVIAAGSDLSAVPLAVGNAHLIEIDAKGTVHVHLGARIRRQRKPYAYQEIDGRRQDVPVRFDIAAAGHLRLVAGPYDRSRLLVIEPQP